MAIKEIYKQELITIISRYLPAAKIYLFGSRAEDLERVGSDVDIALDAGESISYKTILDILVAFDDTCIPFTIDLVDMKNISEDLKKQILKKGVVWKN